MQGLPSTLLTMGAGRDPLARPGGGGLQSGTRAWSKGPGQELGARGRDKSLEHGAGAAGSGRPGPGGAAGLRGLSRAAELSRHLPAASAPASSLLLPTELPSSEEDLQGGG